MRMKKLVVIESPFKTPSPENGGDEVQLHRYLRCCLQDCFERGECPFASHAMYPKRAGGPLDDLKHRERQQGIKAGLEWAAAADLTAVYVDFGVSKGMLKGISHAIKCDRSIEFRSIGVEGLDQDYWMKKVLKEIESKGIS